jgi:type II secretory pathway pseudopilin PulG
MKSSSSESGHLLLALMIGLTVMAIFLTVVVQQWSTLERRENEKELVFRGNQYIKAIKKYQMEHGGAYPTRLESLMELGPRQLRYIRKLYKDPMAPDGKWGILVADPSGKGFINPNAVPEGETIEGLEDLMQRSNVRNDAKKKVFTNKGGFSDWDNPSGNDEEDKNSVTAPGQPTGPIVGVVSLWDQTAFRRYHEHENYSEWTFSIFDLVDQNQQAKQQLAEPVPTPGFGVGPGGQQTIYGLDGNCTGKDCPPGGGRKTP